MHDRQAEVALGYSQYVWSWRRPTEWAIGVLLIMAVSWAVWGRAPSSTLGVFYFPIFYTIFLASDLIRARRLGLAARRYLENDRRQAAVDTGSRDRPT